MRRLLLFRHGQAVPHDKGPDRDRTLTQTGRDDTIAIARQLQESGIDPEIVLVSPASRTRETWDCARAYFSRAKESFIPDLYLATPEIILSHLHMIEDNIKSAMIVGHNPALHDVALELYGYGDRYAFSRLRDEFPTSACAVFDFDCQTWSELALNQGRLDRFLTPS